MPRPRKLRFVCGLPNFTHFGNLEETNLLEKIIMSIDEYETICLIDLQKLTQEECAQQMNVARTTVQAIYNNARSKLADVIVNNKALQIEGGDYRLCDGKGPYCDGRGCHRRHRQGME
jgi:predicted DNA-binding protein (UPF0251 family)